MPNPSEYPDQNKVSDPAASYSGSRKISVFSSFMEAEEAELIFWAGLSPDERLSEFFKLMGRFYTFQRPVWRGTKIVVDR